MSTEDNCHSTDQRLRALQSLSAHLKLLLDTPEHLWRLLESKKYLQATWLFLLARVVHRALMTEDEDGDQQWQIYGIDVSVCAIHGPYFHQRLARFTVHYRNNSL